MNIARPTLAVLALVGAAAHGDELIVEATASVEITTPWESCSSGECENTYSLGRVRVDCPQFDDSLGVLRSIRVELSACGSGVMPWEHPGADDIGGFVSNVTFNYELDGPGISPDLPHSLPFPDRSGTVTPDNRQGQLSWGNTCRTSGRADVSSGSFGPYIGQGTVSLTIDPEFSYYTFVSGGIDELYFFYDFTSNMTARIIYEFETEPCPADFNGDGFVNTQDVTDFLNAFAAGDASADINDDGDVDTQDVLEFLSLWVAGC